MAIEPFLHHQPKIDPSAFVAPSADVIGRVTLSELTSIWYHATLRGDIHEIVIGPRSNVQDNVVIHLADDYGCYVGELVTVGHSAILHACTVKDEVLVGMGAIVLDGAVIGERSIIVLGRWSPVAPWCRRGRWCWGRRGKSSASSMRASRPT